MARTTIDLDPAILRELRHRGAREGKSIGQVASELLAQAFAEPTKRPAPDFTWTVADLGTPLVDLEDPEAVRRALDAPDEPRSTRTPRLRVEHRGSDARACLRARSAAGRGT